MSEFCINTELGKRVKAMRVLHGFTQAQLSKQIGITFQQLQKYESGANRICVSRLFDICKVFAMDISTFLKDFSVNLTDQLSDNGSITFDKKTNNKEIIELVRAFNRINDPLIRKSISVLLKNLSEDTTN